MNDRFDFLCLKVLILGFQLYDFNVESHFKSVPCKNNLIQLLQSYKFIRIN